MPFLNFDRFRVQKFATRAGITPLLALCFVTILLGVFKDSIGQPTKPSTSGQFVAGKSAPVVQLIGARWCPLCHAAEQYLQEEKVAYHWLDIDKDPEGKRAYRALGGGGVPILIIGGEMVRGFDRGAIQSALSRSGKR